VRRQVVGGLVGGLAVGAVALQATRTTAVAGVPHFRERRVSVIAHAGAQGYAPHDTLEAFALGLELGADTLEMDLQLSADGHVVIMHDGSVDRTTDGSGRVRDLTLAEIKRLDAGGWWPGPEGDHPFRGRGVRVPTLPEVFEAFPDAFLLLEMKTDSGLELVAAAAELIERYRRQEQVMVASFDAHFLNAFRRRMPSVPTSIGEGEVRRLYSLHLLGLDPWFRPHGQVVQVPEYAEGRHIVTPRFIRAAHNLGLEVHVWTVNALEDLRRLIALGVDGLVTDYPDRLRALLA
jgi:glycerophosphoryl diester phosphodiesterase